MAHVVRPRVDAQWHALLRNRSISLPISNFFVIGNYPRGDTTLATGQNFTVQLVFGDGVHAHIQ